MHFDLAHAVITVGLIFATYACLYAAGVVKRDDGPRFNWKAAVAVAVVIFLFNLIWPA